MSAPLLPDDRYDLSPHLPEGASEFHPESADREAWARFHEFRRVLEKDLHPEDPIEPDEVAQAALRKPDPHVEERHLVRLSEGRVISTLLLTAHRPGNPEYEGNRHHIWADVRVLPSHRRRGVARAWLPAMAAYARSRGARTVTLDSSHEPGHRFLESMGAEARFRGWESRLWMNRVDWDLVREWARIDSGDLRLESYEPFPPEALWEEYARQYSELERHVPKEQLDVGDWILTPARMASDRQRLQATGRRLHVLAAWDAGGIAGLTEIVSSRHRPEALDQELTAVHPRARGRGLGRLLKARLLLELRGRLPDAEFVRTFNAGSNDAMWAINQAMGFLRHREEVGYQLPVERLESSLAAARAPGPGAE